MGRFYKTHTPKYRDYTYELPQEEMYKALEQDLRTKTVEGYARDFMGSMDLETFDHYSGDLNDALDGYDSDFGDIVDKINQGDQSYIQDMDGMKKGVRRDFSKEGEIGTLTGKYKGFKELEARALGPNSKVSKADWEKNKSYIMDNIGNMGTYQELQDFDYLETPDSYDFGKKIETRLKEDKFKYIQTGQAHEQIINGQKMITFEPSAADVLLQKHPELGELQLLQRAMTVEEYDYAAKKIAVLELANSDQEFKDYYDWQFKVGDKSVETVNGNFGNSSTTYSNEMDYRRAIADNFSKAFQANSIKRTKLTEANTIIDNKDAISKDAQEKALKLAREAQAAAYRIAKLNAETKRYEADKKLAAGRIAAAGRKKKADGTFEEGTPAGLILYEDHDTYNKSLSKFAGIKIVNDNMPGTISVELQKAYTGLLQGDDTALKGLIPKLKGYVETIRGLGSITEIEKKQMLAEIDKVNIGKADIVKGKKYNFQVIGKLIGKTYKKSNEKLMEVNYAGRNYVSIAGGGPLTDVLSTVMSNPALYKASQAKSGDLDHLEEDDFWGWDEDKVASLDNTSFSSGYIDGDMLYFDMTPNEGFQVQSNDNTFLRGDKQYIRHAVKSSVIQPHIFNSFMDPITGYPNAAYKALDNKGKSFVDNVLNPKIAVKSKRFKEGSYSYGKGVDGYKYSGENSVGRNITIKIPPNDKGGNIKVELDVGSNKVYYSNVLLRQERKYAENEQYLARFADARNIQPVAKSMAEMRVSQGNVQSSDLKSEVIRQYQAIKANVKTAKASNAKLIKSMQLLTKGYTEYPNHMAKQNVLREVFNSIY